MVQLPKLKRSLLNVSRCILWIWNLFQVNTFLAGKVFECLESSKDFRANEKKSNKYLWKCTEKQGFCPKSTSFQCIEVNESNEHLAMVGESSKRMPFQSGNFPDGLKTCTRPPTPATEFWWSQQMKITSFRSIHKIDWAVKFLWDSFSFWQYVGARWKLRLQANSNAWLKFPVAPVAIKQAPF